MTISTKETILKVASQLFADSGYDNTSVRDIAKGADVNISAINYHFKSKVGLFAEVLNHNIETLRSQFTELYSIATSTEDCAVRIYSHFEKESNTFYNSMKMFLVNNLPLEEDIIPKSCSGEQKGPPGTEILMEMIRKEIDFKGEETLLLWAARNIMHNIIIISLVSQSSFVKMMNKEVAHFSEEEKIESIRRNVRSTLNFIR